MKICKNCFADIELKTIVSSHRQIGVCDICGHEDYIYDTTLNSALIDTIDDFMNIYSRANDDTPQKYRMNLEKELIYNWNIFSISCAYKVKKIVYMHFLKTQKRDLTLHCLMEMYIFLTF